MRDQIMRCKRLKGVMKLLFFAHPFILSGSLNKCWLHTCDACVITTWRLGLRAPLVACNYLKNFVVLTARLGIFKCKKNVT